MPELKDFRKVEVIELPSFPGSKVEIYDQLIFGNIVQLDELGEDATDMERIIKAASLLIKSWNLTDKDGNVLPITVENIRKLPIKDANILMKKVTEAIEGRPKKGGSQKE